MKVGDLVKWSGSAPLDRNAATRPDTGIVVDGPRDGSNGRGSTAPSYAVAWFDAKTTFWHNDCNLEILSENW